MPPRAARSAFHAGASPMSHHATQDEITGWFAGRLTDGWFVGSPEITVDREEILVVGTLTDVELPADASDAARAAARASRVERFREETRGTRMTIAEDAQHRFRKIVSWGVVLGGERTLFTTAGIPAMTRLRQPERIVLDTLGEVEEARKGGPASA